MMKSCVLMGAWGNPQQAFGAMWIATSIACHLCAPLKIAQNVLTDSVIYVTLNTNNRFGYLKEQNSNGKIFSAFT